MGASIKYIAILVAAFGASHFFFSLLEKADRLPDWLTPMRGALLVTFMVQLWLIIIYTRSGMPVDGP